jgi:regulatory protein
MSLELRQKGLDDEAIRSAMENVDDEASAYEAARRRAVRFKGLEWNDFRKKLSEFLARRGYSSAVIAPVVPRVWNEAHTEEHHYEDEDIT